MKQRFAKGIIYCLICLLALSPLYYIQSIDGIQSDLQTSIQHLQQLDRNADFEQTNFIPALRGSIASLREIAGLGFFIIDRTSDRPSTDAQENAIFYRHPLMVSVFSCYTNTHLLMPDIHFSVLSQYTSIAFAPERPPPIILFS